MLELQGDHTIVIDGKNGVSIPKALRRDGFPQILLAMAELKSEELKQPLSRITANDEEVLWSVGMRFGDKFVFFGLKRILDEIILEPL